MDLPTVLEELYAGPPAEFTATRDARARRARAEGDRDLAARVAGLRRPTVPAWAVNLLVREHREEVERLLELGAAVREATAALAGPELRELSVQQHRVLAALRARAARLTRAAGVRLSPEAGEKVVQTLRAGMTGPAAADAVRSGLLVRPLEAVGLTDVEADVEGATALDAPARSAAPTPAGPAPRVVPPDELKARREEKAAREARRRELELRELREAVAAAREELAEAREEAGASAGDLTSARRRGDDLVRRQEDLRAQLDTVTEQLEAAAGTLRAAERTARAAEERVARAERELERLRARLPD